MKAIWLGQAGLFLNICKKNVLVDPYFSNSVEKIIFQRVARIILGDKMKFGHWDSWKSRSLFIAMDIMNVDANFKKSRKLCGVHFGHSRQQ